VKKEKKRGRPGITLEDVKKAVESLRRQGRRIGPVNVRLELGRGGYGTINEHLRTLGLCATKAERLIQSGLVPLLSF
jgi:hypothetical protein